MGQSQPLHRPAVLVVEDEPVLRLDALDMIEQAGFEAVEATGVEDAIRILEARLDIRLVYMDLDMPRGIRGIEVAAMIRNRWPPIAIILTGAFFGAGDVALPVRAEFFPKPPRRAEITAAMRRMTAQGGTMHA